MKDKYGKRPDKQQVFQPAPYPAFVSIEQKTLR